MFAQELAVGAQVGGVAVVELNVAHRVLQPRARLFHALFTSGVVEKARVGVQGKPQGVCFEKCGNAASVTGHAPPVRASVGDLQHLLVEQRG